MSEWVDESEKERKDKEIFHLVIHFTNSCGSQGWAVPKPVAKSFIQFPTWVQEAQELGPSYVALPGTITGSCIRSRQSGTSTGTYMWFWHCRGPLNSVTILVPPIILLTLTEKYSFNKWRHVHVFILGSGSCSFKPWPLLSWHQSRTAVRYTDHYSAVEKCNLNICTWMPKVTEKKDRKEDANGAGVRRITLAVEQEY